jgi:hypothetical protein
MRRALSGWLVVVAYGGSDHADQPKHDDDAERHAQQPEDDWHRFAPMFCLPWETRDAKIGSSQRSFLES